MSEWGNGAIVVVDAQKAWANENPKTVKTIEEFLGKQRKYLPVIWVYSNILQQIGAPMRLSDPAATDAFNAAAQGIYEPVIRADKNDWIVGKNGNNSSFTSNQKFIDFLEDNKISSLYICGFMASHCVFFSAKDAYDLGFNVNVISDLIADKGDTSYDTAPARYKKEQLPLIDSQDLSFG